MSYLERAYQEHDQDLLFVRTDPEWDSIRSSPRFRELVRRIGGASVVASTIISQANPVA